MTTGLQKDPKNFKQDVNFLNNPLWIPNERAVNTGKSWIDNDGFKYSCAETPPAKTDILFLYYLMYTSQENNWASTLVLTHSDILSACGVSIGKKSKERLKDSLSRWKRVTLSFKGTFYDGIKYSIKEFGIINDWDVVEGTKNIEIEFNANWLKKVKNSTFFKYVSFDQLTKIKAPLAFRLYEILIKTFYKRSEWEIGVHKLAEKIPMAKTQYSHIVPRIKTAVSKINESDADLQIEMKAIKQGPNKGKFVFRRINSLEDKKTSEPEPAKIPSHILELIPEKHRVSCLKLCREIFETYGEQGLKFYVEMTNESKPKKNYGGMLSFFFKNETKFFEEYQAIERETQKAKERLLAKQKESLLRQQEISAKQNEQHLENKKILEAISEMDVQDVQGLDQYIIDQDLNDFEKGRFKKGKKDSLRIRYYSEFQNSVLGQKIAV